MSSPLVSLKSLHSLISRTVALSGAATITALLHAPLPAAAQGTVPETNQRCAIGANGDFRAVIPCGITAINNTLTITWQYSGRGVGTNVAATDQWLGSAGVWRLCSNAADCLEATHGGLQIKQTSCPVTHAMQPIELDRSNPLLPADC